MMRIVFYSLLGMLLSTGFSMAQSPREAFFPASNIQLSYDLKTSMLHVQADHPSQNWQVDYVRMMNVAVNGQQVNSINYSHQTGLGFSDNVQVTAKAGDVITIDLFCTGGMDNTQQTTVSDTAPAT